MRLIGLAVILTFSLILAPVAAKAQIIGNRLRRFRSLAEEKVVGL